MKIIGIKKYLYNFFEKESLYKLSGSPKKKKSKFKRFVDKLFGFNKTNINFTSENYSELSFIESVIDFFKTFFKVTLGVIAFIIIAVLVLAFTLAFLEIAFKFDTSDNVLSFFSLYFITLPSVYFWLIGIGYSVYQSFFNSHYVVGLDAYSGKRFNMGILRKKSLSKYVHSIIKNKVILDIQKVIKRNELDSNDYFDSRYTEIANNYPKLLTEAYIEENKHSIDLFLDLDKNLKTLTNLNSEFKIISILKDNISKLDLTKDFKSFSTFTEVLDYIKASKKYHMIPVLERHSFSIEIINKYILDLIENYSMLDLNNVNKDSFLDSSLTALDLLVSEINKTVNIEHDIKKIDIYSKPLEELLNSQNKFISENDLDTEQLEKLKNIRQ